MRISRGFSHYTSLLFLSLLVIGTTSCSSLLASIKSHSSAHESNKVFPGRGLQVTSFHPGSPAEQAGLKKMDVIFRYGHFDVVDDASYFAARDYYEHGLFVPVYYWSNGKTMRTTVPPGKLGIESNEYGPVASRFSSLMAKLDAQRQIDDYLLEREFKDAFPPPAQLLAEAKAIIDQAERESTLTPTQILVARIDMILDDAPPEDLKRQLELLRQLISTQPLSYLEVLANDHFFQKRHYRPAIECSKRYLELQPDDVSIRLNLGVAYGSLGMYAESEAAADYFLQNNRRLSRHGYAVAFHIKASALLSRGDYDKAFLVARNAFEAGQSPWDIALMQLAAAESGNLAKLTDASHLLEDTLPEEFARRKLQLASAEALALVKNNQRARARELVKNWKDTDRIEGRVKSYWWAYPGGADVWNNWNELARN